MAVDFDNSTEDFLWKLVKRQYKNTAFVLVISFDEDLLVLHNNTEQFLKSITCSVF